MAGLAALAFAYVLSQFYRSFLAVLTPALTAELGMTKTELAWASGLWFLSFALMQFAVGIALDRYGPRRTASLLLGGAGAAGAAVFASATAPWMVVAAMILFGIACSPVLMASYFLFARQYPPHRFAVLASWMVGAGSLGNVLGASPLAAAVQSFGWRAVLVMLGVATLAVAGAVLTLLRDPPSGDTGANTGLKGYGELMRIRALWPILVMIAINYTAAAGIRGLWAGPYLADMHGADALTIGNVTLVMALAMVAGSFAYGPMDTLFNTRKWVIVGGNAVVTATLAWLALATPGVMGATAAFAVIGLFGMSFGLCMAHGRAFIPQHLVGRGVTLMNFFSIGSVAVMQVLTGNVFAATSANGASAGYSAIFAFYAVLFGFALAVYLFSRDAKPRG